MRRFPADQGACRAVCCRCAEETGESDRGELCCEIVVPDPPSMETRSLQLTSPDLGPRARARARIRSESEAVVRPRDLVGPRSREVAEPNETAASTRGCVCANVPRPGAGTTWWNITIPKGLNGYPRVTGTGRRRLPLHRGPARRDREDRPATPRALSSACRPWRPRRAAQHRRLRLAHGSARIHSIS
jgi:hypothetical protein